MKDETERKFDLLELGLDNVPQFYVAEMPDAEEIATRPTPLILTVAPKPLGELGSAAADPESSSDAAEGEPSCVVIRNGNRVRRSSPFDSLAHLV